MGPTVVFRKVQTPNQPFASLISHAPESGRDPPGAPDVNVDADEAGGGIRRYIIISPERSRILSFWVSLPGWLSGHGGRLNQHRFRPTVLRGE